MPLKLPLDVVVKVAFFIPEWPTLATFIQAFKSEKNVDIGPLENLWQLHQLVMDDLYLWPRLDLRQMDEKSLGHFEAIARHYGTLLMNESTNLDWVCQFVDPKAAIDFIESSGLDSCGSSWLSRWKQFQISSLYLTYFTDKVDAALSGLDHLQVLELDDCKSFNAAVVFRFASSSKPVSARGHYNANMERYNTRADFLNCCWSPSRATWTGDTTCRWAQYGQIPTLEYFQLCDSDQSSFIMIAEYTRRSNTLNVSVSGLRLFGYLPMDETNRTCFTTHFQQLLETKTKTLQIAFLSWHQCKVLVKILTMLLHQSGPEKLEIELYKLTKDDMILLAQDFRQQELFREVSASAVIVPFDGAKTLLAAPPPSLKKLELGHVMAETYSDNERNEVQALALDKGIQLGFNIKPSKFGL
ncbi:hypothetical protein AeRB84_016323 [Aphanomyces euteiches]|nr:hypothetical protein AeRB84_016323 [Aphanomyces euteiches]